jgi:hypothetical protein
MLITRHAKYRIVILGVLTLAVLGCGIAAAAEPAQCDVRLSIELTPDVPNARNDEFISSLLGNEVDYQLTLRQEIDDSSIVVELIGPGPGYRCQEVVDVIRRDSRVLSVHVRQES